MLHSELKDAIEREFAKGGVESIMLCRDALVLRLRNGVEVELRFANPHEYAIGWRWGDAQMRIDTAPLHGELATFPNHLHDSEGRLRADPLTQPGIEPWDNVRSVLGALLHDPLLGDVGTLGAAGAGVAAIPQVQSWTS